MIEHGGTFRTHHSNSPETDDGQYCIDWNAYLALLEDSPIKSQYGELDAAYDASVAELRDE